MLAISQHRSSKTDKPPTPCMQRAEETWSQATCLQIWVSLLQMQIGEWVLNLQLCTSWGLEQLEMTLHCHALTIGFSVLRTAMPRKYPCMYIGVYQSVVGAGSGPGCRRCAVGAACHVWPCPGWSEGCGESVGVAEEGARASDGAGGLQQPQRHQQGPPHAVPSLHVVTIHPRYSRLNVLTDAWVLMAWHAGLLRQQWCSLCSSATQDVCCCANHCKF